MRKWSLSQILVGHGCGHNLIAASACGAFLGLVKTLRKFSIPGSVQLLGTLAEESLGGKCVLVKNGAYKNVDSSFMAHPFPENDNTIQISTNAFLACTNDRMGLDSFDVCVASWVNVSLLRQQIMPHQRTHGYFKDGPTVANVIPAKSIAVYQIRSRNVEELKELIKRVENCCVEAATATCCDDVGNVSYEVPDIHLIFGIPTLEKFPIYLLIFAKCAGNLETLISPTLNVANVLANSAYKILDYDELFETVKKDYAEITSRIKQ